ncbi:MAG TPA: hypothetical protein VGC72_06500 [Candidatus Elarobacter sp.]|jgi:hypothetical protein
MDANRHWLATARKDAVAGRPPQDALGPDVLDMEIAAAYKKFFADEKKPIIKDTERIAERLIKARADVGETKQSINGREPVSHLEDLLNADLEEARPHNVRLLAEKRVANSHLSVFKTENGLTRPAEKSKKRLDVLSPIIFVLLFETLINAYFYQSGVGLLAGAMIAFFISGIIAAIGFGTGFLSRFRNAKSLPERIGGWLALVIGTAMAIYVSSVTATFRALVEIAKQSDRLGDVSAQSIDLFTRAIADGYQIFFFHVPFHEINATLLFAVAIIAFVNAAIQGYGCSDPVPGYSKASEQFERCDAQTRAAETALRTDLLNRASEIKMRRLRLVAAINDAVKLHGDSDFAFKRSEQRLAELAQEMNDTYRQAITDCRVENTRHRPTQPPAYFSNAIDDISFDMNTTLFDNVRTALDEFEGEIEEVKPQVETLHSEIGDVEQLRATLAEKITSTIKGWDAEAEHDLDQGIIFGGIRGNAQPQPVEVPK